MHLVSKSAESFLEEALLSHRSFDLVDLDPFGACYELLPLVARLVPRGVVCITSGEIFQVYRGLNRARGRPPAAQFRGHKVSQWVVESLLPEVLKVYTEAKLVHFYAYPTSVRVILALGGFPLSAHIFRQRPRFLGWLRSADVSAAQCLDIQQNED